MNVLIADVQFQFNYKDNGLEQHPAVKEALIQAGKLVGSWLNHDATLEVDIYTEDEPESQIQARAISMITDWKDISSFLWKAQGKARSSDVIPCISINLGIVNSDAPKKACIRIFCHELTHVLGFFSQVALASYEQKSGVGAIRLKSDGRYIELAYQSSSSENTVYIPNEFASRLVDRHERTLSDLFCLNPNAYESYQSGNLELFFAGTITQKVLGKIKLQNKQFNGKKDYNHIITSPNAETLMQSSFNTFNDQWKCEWSIYETCIMMDLGYKVKNKYSPIIEFILKHDDIAGMTQTEKLALIYLAEQDQLNPRIFAKTS